MQWKKDARRALEIRRQHADDFRHGVVQLQYLSNHVVTSAKSPLPVAEPDHHDGGAPVARFLLAEPPPANGRDAERVEIVRIDLHAAYPFRFRAVEDER